MQREPENESSATRSWHEWEVRGGDRRIILCIETSLELRPGFDGFDPDQLEALLASAERMMRSSASPIDAIRVVPIH